MAKFNLQPLDDRVVVKGSRPVSIDADLGQGEDVYRGGSGLDPRGRGDAVDRGGAGSSAVTSEPCGAGWCGDAEGAP